MGNCTTAEHPGASVLSARTRLAPRLTGVINALANEGDTGSFFAVGAYVQDLQDRLRSIASKRELLHLLLDMALIEFQGFEFSASTQRAVDALRDECEKVARTTSARNTAH